MGQMIVTTTLEGFCGQDVDVSIYCDPDCVTDICDSTTGERLNEELLTPEHKRLIDRLTDGRYSY